jgi:hypothetical protein
LRKILQSVKKSYLGGAAAGKTPKAGWGHSPKETFDPPTKQGKWVI